MKKYIFILLLVLNILPILLILIWFLFGIVGSYGIASRIILSLYVVYMDNKIYIIDDFCLLIYYIYLCKGNKKLLSKIFWLIFIAVYCVLADMLIYSFYSVLMSV